MQTSSEQKAAARSIYEKTFFSRNADRQNAQRNDQQRNVAHATSIPDAESSTPYSDVALDDKFIPETTSGADERYERIIPELGRAARDAFVATAVDGRAARLAFAAAVPPQDAHDNRNDEAADAEENGPRVDYCVFCYHGPHLLNHEVSDLLYGYYDDCSDVGTPMPHDEHFLLVQNSALLTKFVSDRGSILPKRFTHCCAKHQRQ